MIRLLAPWLSFILFGLGAAWVLVLLRMQEHLMYSRERISRREALRRTLVEIVQVFVPW